MSYLRFGKLPAGSSRLFGWADWQEDGVSVFEAGTTPGGYVIWLGHPFQIHDLIRVLKERRPLYRVEGREVGRGLSKEPLLADARIVGSVPPDAEITVSGAGICAVYVRALLAEWSDRAAA